MELRNCPFCGSDALETFTHEPDGCTYVFCAQCDCTGPRAFLCKEAASYGWNRRGDDGRFPAFLKKPSDVWPDAYVDGWNDALQIAREEGFGPTMSSRYTITEAGRAMLRDAQQGEE